jgi:hypothetical protein
MHQALKKLVGTWVTEATHPDRPGLTVHGTVTSEWLEGGPFVILRARTDHPDFPDGISIIGDTDHDRVDESSGAPSTTADATRLRMHYFDSRGVYRLLDASIDDVTWRLAMESPGFSQRFTGTFSDGGATIVGQWQLRRDDVHWKDDLAITYRRQR